MSDKNIQQVLEIEKKAAEMQERAKREAQEIPVKAEQEAQAMIAKAIAEAQEEARKMVANAKADDASGNAAADIASQNTEFEANAKKNFDKAVAFVLERVIGKG
jgi:vacuolar-type H+-ATPase subunit H